MNWTPLLFIVAMIVVIFLARRVALLSAKDAHRYLREGAVIVDVRTPEEFSKGHVPSAINLPLPDLPRNVLAQFPKKDQVILLHCLGGGRSAVARQRLRAQGYLHVHNLGSLGRAQRITSNCSLESGLTSTIS